jgi:hypothetical protein
MQSESFCCLIVIKQFRKAWVREFYLPFRCNIKTCSLLSIDFAFFDHIINKEILALNHLIDSKMSSQKKPYPICNVYKTCASCGNFQRKNMRMCVCATKWRTKRQITFQPVNLFLQLLDGLLSELGASLSLK